MTQRNPGRLAIHRRSDEIAFLQHRLRDLGHTEGSSDVDESSVVAADAAAHENQDQLGVAQVERDAQREVLARERDLADELLHTRQIEPLGETLQRRLAMAERICRDLAPRNELVRSDTDTPADQQGDERNRQSDWPGRQDRLSDACWVAEIERQALTEMLNQWWSWLRDP